MGANFISLFGTFLAGHKTLGGVLSSGTILRIVIKVGVWCDTYINVKEQKSHQAMHPIHCQIGPCITLDQALAMLFWEFRM